MSLNKTIFYILEEKKMEELKNKFIVLSDTEKLQFFKEITPELCRLCGENPQAIMPYCKDMMKDCNMDMSQMMAMMNNMK